MASKKNRRAAPEEHPTATDYYWMMFPQKRYATFFLNIVYAMFLLLCVDMLYNLMEGVLTPIAVNLWYNCCDPDRESEYVWSREKLPVDDRTSRMGRFLFRGLDCVGAEVSACYVDGLPEAPIEEVALENIRIRFSPEAKPGVPIMENFAKKRCRLGLYLDNVRRVRVRDVTIEGAEGDGLIVGHCEELETDGLTEKPL